MKAFFGAVADTLDTLSAVFSIVAKAARQFSALCEG